MLMRLYIVSDRIDRQKLERRRDFVRCLTRLCEDRILITRKKKEEKLEDCVVRFSLRTISSYC